MTPRCHLTAAMQSLCIHEGRILCLPFLGSQLAVLHKQGDAESA